MGIQEGLSAKMSISRKNKNARSLLTVIKMTQDLLALTTKLGSMSLVGT